MIIHLIDRDLDQYVRGYCFHVKIKVFLDHSSIPFEIASKKKGYSTDFRFLVIECFLNGDSYVTIAKKVLTLHLVIQFIIKKYKKKQNDES